MSDQIEKRYSIVNLGCANCAAKMENAINSDKRILSASINFMNSSLVVSYKKDAFISEEESFQTLNNYISKFERDAYIEERSTKTPDHSHKQEHCGCGEHHEEHDHCGCGEHHEEHDHCGCGGHHEEHDHCGCGEHHEEHDHCGCGGHHEEHDHCGCGEHHEEHNESVHEHSHSKTTVTRNELFKTIFPWTLGILISFSGILFIENPIAKLLVVLIGYLVLGREVVLNSIYTVKQGSIFDENFLMIIATIGALYTGEYPEAIMVLLLFQIGELLQDLAVDRSKRHLATAMNLKSLYATVETPNGLQQIAPEEVEPGMILVVKPSEKIALDGIVVEGTSFIDTSSLTGESLPRKADIGDEILSGCINGNQTIKIKVTKPYTESTVAKIIDLVENASNRKSVTETFITKFARIYTPIVVLLAVILAIVPPIVTGSYDFSRWIYSACGFLVVSCPCALVISVPLGFFGGLGCASKNGIIIKGSNYLEGLTTLKTVVFDKTGTLTKGCFEVKEIHSLTEEFSEREILRTAALLESFSTHPIATSVVEAYKQKDSTALQTEQLTQFQEVSGHGVQAKLQESMYSLGNRRHMEMIHATNLPDAIDTIGTVIYLAKDNQCIGYLIIADEIKEDSKATIETLKRHGIKTVLLTGDSKAVADKVASHLGIDSVYAELLPTDKVAKLEEVMATQSGHQTTAFVGDGINDAPVIARSDIGMAMGGVGSDAAIEAADIVLMTDEPSKIARSIEIAKHTKFIVTQNIIFSLGVKAIVLLLLALGYGSMWLAIFADVGVSLIAIVNSIRALKA